MKIGVALAAVLLLTACSRESKRVPAPAQKAADTALRPHLLPGALLRKLKISP